METTKQNPWQRALSLYGRIWQYIAGFENWPTCLWLRYTIGRPSGARALVRLRNGLRFNVRVGTPDICILWEVFFGGAYRSAEDIVRDAQAGAVVFDLGGNIGAFALRMANEVPPIHVRSYEPGPQNASIFRENLDLNPQLRSRITLIEEAVSSASGTAQWRFDSENPGGSSLYGSGEAVTVKTRSIQEILRTCDSSIALLKIDIEGAEFDLLQGAVASDWRTVPAVYVEFHLDPSGRSTPAEWLHTMRSFGFVRHERQFSTILLQRENEHTSN